MRCDGGYMRDDSPQWREVGEPASPEEAEALRVIKRLLPEAAICWAWSNLTFTDTRGRLSETDLLLLTQTGMTLIELKGWSGRITGAQRRWVLARGEVDNPRYLTDQKAKWLKALLEYVQEGNRRVPLPRIRAITVLHGPNCVVDLDDPSKTDTYGLDGYDVAGVPLFSSYLTQPLLNIRDQVDRARARQIVDLINKAGFEPPARVRMVGQYAVERLAQVAQGPTWADVIAENPHMPGLKKRIRLFDVPRDCSAERRAQIKRAAERELRLTTGLAHPGVVGPSDISQDDAGRPALIFDFDPKAQRLDEWLAKNEDTLLPERRFEVIRRLGEVMQYAHNRGVTHRALTPRQVYVVDEPGKPLLVTVRDWQTGRESPDVEHSTATRPHTLSFLPGVNGVPATHLGVTRFGQSGDLASVYRYHGLDSDAIVGAALDLVD